MASFNNVYKKFLEDIKIYINKTSFSGHEIRTSFKEVYKNVESINDINKIIVGSKVKIKDILSSKVSCIPEEELIKLKEKIHTVKEIYGVGCNLEDTEWCFELSWLELVK